MIANRNTVDAEYFIRVLTCAVCDRVIEVCADGVTLPLHWRRQIYGPGDVPVNCEGSLTRGYPHRPLPEIKPIKPLKIEILPDDDETPVNVSAIIECARFLNKWLTVESMKIDNVQMSKIAAHAHRARTASLGLMKV